MIPHRSYSSQRSADEMTEEEIELIQKLRERIADVLPPEKDSDAYLRKWLLARNLDVEKAEDMLRKHISYVKAHGLDKIDKNYVPKKATEYFHTAHLGYDKEGSIVRILHLGAADIKGLTLSLSRMDSIKMATHLIITDLEKQQIDRQNDSLCDKQVYVFDLQGLTWSAVLYRAVAERAYVLLKCYEANFPENLKIVYVINAPSFFSFIYNWLKTVLPMSILSKVEIVPSENCQAVVSKFIDPSILPVSVGGLLIGEDGDPNCPFLYKMPLYAPVPDSLMLTNQLGILDSDPKALKSAVGNGSSLTLQVEVPCANSVLNWDFQTMFYDISFGLAVKESEDTDSKEIIPQHRVESHRIPESGSFTCEKPGIYEIKFDNSYSWMTKKDIIYKISVSPPDNNVES